MMDICSAGALSVDFADFLTTTILPLAGIAAITTSVIVAFSYMIGNILNNPKLLLWAKTEVVQVFISLATVLFLGTMINTFCAVNMGEISSIFETSLSASSPPDSIYDAAETYLVEAAFYSRNAMAVARYHAEVYTIMSYLSMFECDAFRCLFGHAGTTQQPFGGFGALLASVNIFFNSALMAHINVLSHIYLLMFTYRGFVFLFLPLGIFFRSMPYMRRFGSLLMSIAICFLLVYPFMLSVFYLMGDVLVDRPDYSPDASLLDFRNNERIFYDRGGDNSAAAGWALAASMQLAMPGGQEWFENSYLPSGSARPVDAIMFCASAFVAAVFMPTVALLATIASISYVARLMGEQVDLSTITRMI